jgi:hypothetical protein
VAGASKPETHEELMRAGSGSHGRRISARLEHRFFVGSSHPGAYGAGMSLSSRMIFESAHRSGRDQQQRRAVRRRIRETLAVRRAAAVGEHGAGQPPDEPPVEPRAAG